MLLTCNDIFNVHFVCVCVYVLFSYLHIKIKDGFYRTILKMGESLVTFCDLYKANSQMARNRIRLDNETKTAGAFCMCDTLQNIIVYKFLFRACTVMCCTLEMRSEQSQNGHGTQICDRSSP